MGPAHSRTHQPGPLDGWPAQRQKGGLSWRMEMSAVPALVIPAEVSANLLRAGPDACFGAGGAVDLVKAQT